jgi:hypothetical protein
VTERTTTLTALPVYLRTSPLDVVEMTVTTLRVQDRLRVKPRCRVMSTALRPGAVTAVDNRGEVPRKEPASAKEVSRRIRSHRSQRSGSTACFDFGVTLPGIRPCPKYDEKDAVHVSRSLRQHSGTRSWNPADSCTMNSHNFHLPCRRVRTSGVYGRLLPTKTQALAKRRLGGEPNNSKPKMHGTA